jgi:hypothetical protein
MSGGWDDGKLMNEGGIGARLEWRLILQQAFLYIQT